MNRFDITYCTNRVCKVVKCDRHRTKSPAICVSQADLRGTDVCKKRKKSRLRAGKDREDG